MGNKDSKETQSEQESDGSDTDCSLADDLSTQLGIHEEHGDENGHDTILGSDGNQLDGSMSAEGTSIVGTGEADLDVQEHIINQGVSGTIKGSATSATDLQSTINKRK